ncbi:MAG: hypothetical protein ACR2PF_06860, partial [Rhizobiaceae bacterium]
MIALPGSTVEIVDARSGERFAQLPNITGTEITSSLHITPDRKRLLQINEDGKIALYRIADGKRLMSGYYLDDELVLYTDDGYYLATPEGAHFVYLKFAGLRGYHSFHQFDKALNRPDIIRKIVAGETSNASPPDLPPPPSLTIAGLTQATAGKATLQVTASSPTRLQAINVFADGRLVKKVEEPKTESVFAIDLSLAPEARWVTALAVDANGIESIPQTIAIAPATPRPKPRGVLYAVGVGIDRFTHPRLENLLYAGNDARNFIAHAKRYAGPYYRKVETVPPIIDAPDLGAAIRESLERVVANATVDDTVMLLVA